MLRSRLLLGMTVHRSSVATCPSWRAVQRTAHPRLDPGFGMRAAPHRSPVHGIPGVNQSPGGCSDTGRMERPPELSAEGLDPQPAWCRAVAMIVRVGLGAPADGTPAAGEEEAVQLVVATRGVGPGRARDPIPIAAAPGVLRRRVGDAQARSVRCHVGAISPSILMSTAAVAVVVCPVEAYGARSIGPRSRTTPRPLQ
jgi:hypothetical protein